MEALATLRPLSKTSSNVKSSSPPAEEGVLGLLVGSAGGAVRKVLGGIDAALVPALGLLVTVIPRVAT